jgi:hypothetical protein
MTNVTMKLEQSQPQTDAAVHLFDNWFDPIEAGLRDRVREFIHAMVEGELDMALSRPRYARCAKARARSGGRGRCQWPPPRPSVAVAAWKLRDQRARRNRMRHAVFGLFELELELSNHRGGHAA